MKINIKYTPSVIRPAMHCTNISGKHGHKLDFTINLSEIPF